MLSEFQRMWAGCLDINRALNHRIELASADERPILSASYRACPRAREFEKLQIKKMLEMDVFEPVKREWVAPITFEPKKYETLQFCVDYRKLKPVTIWGSHPMPRMNEFIDSPGNPTNFYTLDASSCYWTVEVANGDRDKTFFAYHHGLLLFIRIPFSLKSDLRRSNEGGTLYYPRLSGNLPCSMSMILSYFQGLQTKISTT